MDCEEMKQRITHGIHETLISHVHKPIEEQTSAATVAVGMAIAMRLCDILQLDEYTALVENIIGSIKPPPPTE
ncbi:hypothetical protein [Pseudomonas tohonis]|uniref:hypothetical protein n=1 Tax=Pseudomonas tohonis TaxID=2725477 RepID=UPI001F258BFF|nr:hypothetical protein [Pseudomonas tohonis]